MSEGWALGGRVSGENLLTNRPLSSLSPVGLLSAERFVVGGCRRRHCLSVLVVVLVIVCQSVSGGFGRPAGNPFPSPSLLSSSNCRSACESRLYRPRERGRLITAALGKATNKREHQPVESTAETAGRGQKRERVWSGLRFPVSPVATPDAGPVSVSLPKE